MDGEETSLFLSNHRDREPKSKAHLLVGQIRTYIESIMQFLIKTVLFEPVLGQCWADHGDFGQPSL